MHFARDVHQKLKVQDMKNHEKSLKNESQKSAELMSACTSSSMPKKAAPDIPGHPLMTGRVPQGSWEQGGSKVGARVGEAPGETHHYMWDKPFPPGAIPGPRHCRARHDLDFLTQDMKTLQTLT